MSNEELKKKIAIILAIKKRILQEPAKEVPITFTNNKSIYKNKVIIITNESETKH